jgi:hypothetical protein
MTDIPDNVSLQWLARHLVSFREETRHDFAELRRDIRHLSEDVTAMRDDIRVLTVDAGDLRERIETLEKGE